MTVPYACLSVLAPLEAIHFMTAHAASHVYFGLDAMWISTCILATTYAVVMSEQVNRAIVALVGAGVMIVIGVLEQKEAIKASTETRSACSPP
jgi:hypothetical protein